MTSSHRNASYTEVKQNKYKVIQTVHHLFTITTLLDRRQCILMHQVRHSTTMTFIPTVCSYVPYECHNKLRPSPGPQGAGWGPPSKDGPAKNLYTKSERLTLSCRVTWACSGRVNLYSRQILVLYVICTVDRYWYCM
jgi:hypothetical protein